MAGQSAGSRNLLPPALTGSRSTSHALHLQRWSLMSPATGAVLIFIWPGVFGEAVNARSCSHFACPRLKCASVLMTVNTSCEKDSVGDHARWTFTTGQDLESSTVSIPCAV